jgi:NAD+ synthase (glutamine-hydrolysing)
MRRHPLDIMGWFADGTLFRRLGWGDEATFLGWFDDTAGWVKDLEWVDRQLRINYFKRIQAPPIIVLSKRAFGFDLRESQVPEYRPRAYGAVRAALLERGIASLVAAMR